MNIGSYTYSHFLDFLCFADLWLHPYHKLHVPGLYRMRGLPGKEKVHHHLTNLPLSSYNIPNDIIELVLLGDQTTRKHVYSYQHNHYHVLSINQWGVFHEKSIETL